MFYNGPIRFQKELMMKPSCIVTALFSSSERFDGYPPKNTFNGKTAKLNMKDHYPTTFRTLLSEVRGGDKP